MLRASLRYARYILGLFPPAVRVEEDKFTVRALKRAYTLFAVCVQCWFKRCKFSESCSSRNHLQRQAKGRESNRIMYGRDFGIESPPANAALRYFQLPPNPQSCGRLLKSGHTPVRKGKAAPSPARAFPSGPYQWRNVSGFHCGSSAHCKT